MHNVLKVQLMVVFSVLVIGYCYNHLLVNQHMADKGAKAT